MATRPWVTIVFLCIGLDFHSVLFYLFIYLFYNTENWTQDLKFDRQVLYLWAPFLVLTWDFFLRTKIRQLSMHIQFWAIAPVSTWMLQYSLSWW